MSDVHQRITDLLHAITAAMGLSLTIETERTADGLRLNLTGDGAEALLWQRGEALKALQHVVDTVFHKQLGQEHVHIDCLGFRKDKDAELRHMARFLADKAKQTGADQELGPLNPYERRIVHLAVAEDPAVVSESIGDAHMKTVIISARRP